ncbi:MAG: adenylate/guanylate cyclase domain-containing protein [Chlamydiota bacterium]
MATKTYWPLRVKLFLAVGSLFVLFFLGTLALERIVVGSKLSLSETILRKEVKKSQDQKRRKLQGFLQKALLEKQAQLDALFYEMSVEPLPEGIVPQSRKETPWAFLSSLIIKNPWVSFAQLETGKGAAREAFSMNMHDVGKEYVSVYEVSRKLSWIFVEDRLYLSLVFPQEWLADLLGRNSPLLLRGNLRIAYDWKTLLYGAYPEKKLQGPFEKLLKTAKNYLRDNESLLQKENFRELLKSARKKKSSRKGSLYTKKPGDPLQQEWQEAFLHFLSKMQIMALAEFSSSMNETHSLPHGILGPSGPVGIVYQELPKEKEVFVSLRTIFSQKTPLEGASAGLIKDSEPFSVHLQTDPLSKEAFLTKTKKITKEDKSQDDTYLTLSVTLDPIMKNLAMVAREHILILGKGGASVLYGPEGDKLVSSAFYEIDPKAFGTKNMGKIFFRGREYYFLRITPFSNLSVATFLIEPAGKALSIARHMNLQLKKVVASISQTISINALILLCLALLVLEVLSRKITKPITRLASVSKKIKEGHLQDLELPPIEPGASREVVSLLTSFNSMAKELAEKDKVRSILNKIVSKQIASELLKNEIHLGGELRDVVVLFADIRDFTKITEYMAPGKVIEMLNTCMTKLTAIIEKHTGVVDKYVGDQVMALFGAPIAVENPYHLAIETALAMQRALEVWNKQRKAEKEPIIELGIGINGGKMLAGNMGAADRLNYTVVGSHVNLAARLCKNAKPGEILLTEHALQEEGLQEDLLLDQIGEKLFKGFSAPHTVYKVLGKKPRH